jgi:hypothetical protein
VTVPAAAVQTSSRGPYVYVVANNDTAEQRRVTVTQTENNVALIASGVKAGELVVIAGQSQLRQGAKVRVQRGDDNTVAAAANSNAPPGANVR